MYLECYPFLEKERDGGGPIAPMCPFVAFLIVPLLAGKCPFCTVVFPSAGDLGKIHLICGQILGGLGFLHEDEKSCVKEQLA